LGLFHPAPPPKRAASTPSSHSSSAHYYCALAHHQHHHESIAKTQYIRISTLCPAHAHSWAHTPSGGTFLPAALPSRNHESSGSEPRRQSCSLGGEAVQGRLSRAVLPPTRYRSCKSSHPFHLPANCSPHIGIILPKKSTLPALLTTGPRV
jgi:hypothetical protein